ncbi:MAG: hypothetical protein JWL86_3660 [Rhizobium sp.]|nr:hypothetical protein [Rhizobium sp.]
MFLFEGPEDADITILLAHGAGAPMDSASMTAASAALSGVGFRVARFEFDYMAARRTSESRKPPPKAELLMDEYRAAIETLGAKGKIIIGGKSMGGRVASMIADELRAVKKVAGLLCLGYPFHPPGKPESLRTKHLEAMKTPALICQGTRDIFGSKEEVPFYPLSKKIEVVWFEDGDHDLKPRKAISGFSHTDHMKSMADAAKDWAGRLDRPAHFVQARRALSDTSIAPSARDTGQPAFALSASSLNLASSMPGTVPTSSMVLLLMVAPPPLISRSIVAVASSLVAGVPFSARKAESCMEKQPACAAAISSSGLVPD